MVILNLLNLGANPRICNRQGRSVLHYPQNLDRELLETFIKGGADLEAKDKTGLTPLLTAAHFGLAFRVKEFISLGANIYARDNNGKNAWDHTPRRHEGDFIQRLAGKAKELIEHPSTVKGVLDYAATTRRPPKGWKK